ncbi:MAG: acyl-CoA desaturase [Gemmataceae bacterium]
MSEKIGTEREAGGHVPISSWMKLANLIAVAAPFAGLIGALVFLWGWGFSWVDFGLLVGLYILTAFGVTIGYHRLFTHRAFKTSRVVQAIFAVLGGMAAQGPLTKWVAVHRRHHRFSDESEDPHSPNAGRHGLLGMLAGLWHAHMGWLFKPESADLDRYANDIRQSKLLSRISGLFLLWLVLGLALPAMLGGILTQSWLGALLGFLWGGLVRIFLVHHVTWSVNSVCHLWGRQPYAGIDESRNNLIFGILAMGEGWHNNHHAFPTSARHGLRWWQIDFSYCVIRLLAWCRLAWDVKTPRPHAAPHVS